MQIYFCVFNDRQKILPMFSDILKVSLVHKNLQVCKDQQRIKICQYGHLPNFTKKKNSKQARLTEIYQTDFKFMTNILTNSLTNVNHQAVTKHNND